MDNTVLAYNGIELYQSEIDILCHEYLDSIGVIDNIKPMQFNGMLLYIYNNKLRYIIPDTYKNDYELLNNIFFDIYIPLCCKYGFCPTILQFTSHLVRIDNKTLSQIRNGVYADGSKVNKITCETVEKWFDICESGLLSKAVETNGIGAIFALKANYKYRDNDIPAIQFTTKQENSTPEQLADKYGSIEKPAIEQIE